MRWSRKIKGEEDRRRKKEEGGRKEGESLNVGQLAFGNSEAMQHEARAFLPRLEAGRMQGSEGYLI